MQMRGLDPARNLVNLGCVGGPTKGGKVTKKQLVDKLNMIAETYRYDAYDAEIGHSKADKALIEYINDKSVEEAFSKIRKFYA